MRILQGKHAGRHLTSPGRAVRPTPEAIRDRALELVGESLAGARFLDLFAGSGAVGLEALSRGARSVDFVENGTGALHALKANVAALRESRRTRIFKRDVIPWIRALDEGAYDVAYADPPYGSRKLDLVIERWLEVPFAATLVLEHAKDHRVEARGHRVEAGGRRIVAKVKRYDFEGPTRISILRA